MAQPNSTQGVVALASLFRVLDNNGHVPAWYEEKARLVWASWHSDNGDSVSIPKDRETLNLLAGRAQMSEVLEGEVGRSFTFNGVEYWAREPDIPEPVIDFESPLWAMGRTVWRSRLVFGAVGYWAEVPTLKITSVTGY